MGFLDDLDNAFDNLLSPQKAAEPAPEPPSSVEEDPIAADLARLQADLAGNHSQSLLALMALIDKGRRQYWIGAMSGALTYLQDVETQASRKEPMKTMAQLLKTRKGQRRKVLSKPISAQLKQLSHSLFEDTASPASGEADSLLNALAKTPSTGPDAAHSLFSAGIWQATQVGESDLAQLAQISGLSDAQLSALQAILRD